MKIALVVLTRGSVSGGFEKYIQRMVPLLRQQPEVERLDLFLPQPMAGPGDLTWPAHDELRRYRDLRRLIATRSPDVLFIPTARALRVDNVPVVTMVRNMEPLEVPFEGNGPLESLKNIGRAWAARHSSTHSDRVIAVSEHVRDFILRRWRIPEEQVGMVYHGIDAANDPASASRPAELESLADHPFLFTAGSVRPARGLEDVVVALSKLPAMYKLVIAGKVDRGAEHYERAMRRLARDRGIEERVVWAGKLDQSEMTWCFRQAEVFVMTSRAEACPNIVLEAMSAGAASVSTDHAPMPEFFGDAALYYRARDAADLADKLLGVLAERNGLRASLRERARMRAVAFSWESTARATVRELQQALRD